MFHFGLPIGQRWVVRASRSWKQHSPSFLGASCPGGQALGALVHSAGKRGSWSQGGWEGWRQRILSGAALRAGPAGSHRLRTRTRQEDRREAALLFLLRVAGPAPRVTTGWKACSPSAPSSCGSARFGAKLRGSLTPASTACTRVGPNGPEPARQALKHPRPLSEASASSCGLPSTRECPHGRGQAATACWVYISPAPDSSRGGGSGSGKGQC